MIVGKRLAQFPVRGSAAHARSRILNLRFSRVSSQLRIEIVKNAAVFPNCASFAKMAVLADTGFLGLAPQLRMKSAENFPTGASPDDAQLGKTAENHPIAHRGPRRGVLIHSPSFCQIGSQNGRRTLSCS
jgi:hypothetical protein